MSFKGLYLVREWYFQSYFISEIIGVRIEQMHMNEKITYMCACTYMYSISA